METARQVAPDIHVLPSSIPALDSAVLPVNAYVLKAKEPVLIDAGLYRDADEFMTALESVIAPEDLRWLYLTHPDPDHVGSLRTVLERAPNARLITTYLGFGILNLSTEVDMQRAYFLNPGEEIDVGDRRLAVLRPPTFDSPATTAFYDSKSRALFSSDCFGALLPELADEAGAVSEAALREGQVLWTTVDAPWLHTIDRTAFAKELKRIQSLDPELVLSAHLPPARSMAPWMLESLAAAPDHEPFVGPDQPALEAMVAELTATPAGVG